MIWRLSLVVAFLCASIAEAALHQGESELALVLAVLAVGGLGVAIWKAADEDLL